MLFLFNSIGCKNIENNIYTGELVQKLILPSSNYIIKDSLGNISYNLLDSLKIKNNLSDSETQSLNYYNLIQKNHLEGNEQISIILSNDNTRVQAFLTNSDKQRFSKYTTTKLLNDSIIVLVKFKGRKISNDIVIISEILSITETHGETKIIK